jgi:hypothetical protein
VILVTVSVIMHSLNEWSTGAANISPAGLRLTYSVTGLSGGEQDTLVSQATTNLTSGELRTKMATCQTVLVSRLAQYQPVPDSFA